MTDLSSFKPKSDEITVKIRSPKDDEVLLNEDGSEMTVTVFAPHTKEYKEVQYEFTDDAIKKSRGKKDYIPSAKDVDEKGLELVCKITKDWNITYDGVKPKLTDKKVKEVYEEVYFIRPQIEEALRNVEDFT